VLGTTIAFTGLNGAAWSSVSEPTRACEHGKPLDQFHYGQVKLQPGLHQSQLEQTHGVLMGLNEDSLLRPFRLAAGLPAPGWDLEGWYSTTPAIAKSGAKGPETFGQWISALSRYYAATGEEETRLKVRRLVEGYAKTLEPTGRIFELGDNPTYHYDKLICGLEDAYEFAGVESALGLISAVTKAALPHLAGRAIDQLGPDGEKSSESYTVPENQFIAWQRGAGQRHLDLAKQYLADDFYFEPLARGQNVLSLRHAYSHVNALCSAAKAYLVLGDEKYLKAAVNGFAFVEQQSWATGGWGPNESFLPGVESLGEILAQTSYHFETPCGSYAHFKLTRYLIRITKDPHYGDSMERVMYNTVLGALPLNQFGKAFYQSNYHSHAHKSYFDGYGNVMRDEWPCCSGTLPQVAADYLISTYFNDHDGVFVNLFIPSTLRWEHDGTHVSLTQSGAYPLDDTVIFDISAPRPVHFALRLRIPAWCRAATIRVNGKHLPDPPRGGEFAIMRREWKSGDRIELELSRELQLEPVDAQHPGLVALTCGPLVLFALSDDTPRVTRAQLLAARQENKGSTEWRTDTERGSLRLVPFWAIKDETYFTYLSVDGV
jgi:DUF1680 family protein